MAQMFVSGDAYEVVMGRWSARIAPLFADFAGVCDECRVLDVGCGTGALVRTVADMTQRCEIVGIDPAKPFIEYCRSRFAQNRFSFEVGDALALPFADKSFDQCFSLLVLMFIPQPEQAVSEMKRVTRPGGTVAACTWDRDGLEMNALFWEEAIKRDPAAEAKAERTRHFNREGQLARLWEGAGLVNVRETLLQIETPFTSFDDYWLPYSGGVARAGLYVSGLSDERRGELREALRTRLLPGGTEGPFTLKAKAWAVRGTVPE